MKLKEKIIKVLEENRGTYLSGEEIANECNVSRAAIWKVIKGLRQEGYVIDAIRNKGYALLEETDILSASAIEKYLNPSLKNLSLKAYKTIDSTNTALISMAQKGAIEGTILLAEEQTAGKGRKGRSFFSPSKSGLYLSILFRPPFSTATASLLTSAAAAGVAEAVEAISGEKTEIKWVNDVLIGGKKICGILTEASLSVESDGLDYAVVGIGINVYTPDNGFPAELQQIVTSIFGTDTKINDARNRLAAEIINNLFSYYHHLEDRSFLPAYKGRLHFLGREVRVIQGEDSYLALAEDITDDCRLIIRKGDGTMATLSGGEISIRF